MEAILDLKNIEPAALAHIYSFLEAKAEGDTNDVAMAQIRRFLRRDHAYMVKHLESGTLGCIKKKTK